MKHPTLKSLAFLVVTTCLTSSTFGQGPLIQRLRERMAERKGSVDAVELSYGKDPLQKLDYWKPVKAGSPIVIFVHGGGWKRGDKKNATGEEKPGHYLQQGYAFASLNYRLVPAATVEQQAQDVALALKALLDRAGALGIDRRRVVLMGHSAGAHLVALVGTDERYLKSAGLTFADVSGVIPIDGAAYDVPAQMADAGAMMQPIYAAAFGQDKTRQQALSPTRQAGAPNAPAFLLLHVQRADGVRQAQALETALARAGTAVSRQSFSGTGMTGHMEINRRMGDPDYPATPAVDAWLRQVFSG
jgi:arylformamidase